MNTIARQSNSNTFVKAFAAAVLLVTCFNVQATESATQEQSEMFRAETLSSIYAEQNKHNIIAPSLAVFETATRNAAVSANMRAETFASIEAEMSHGSVIAPSYEIFAQTAAKATNSVNMYSETLASIQSEQSLNTFAPNLDALNIALADADIEPTVYTRQARVDSKELDATRTSILPVIASLGTINLNAEDASSREATMIALDFAIEALETAKTNFSVDQRAIL